MSGESRGEALVAEAEKVLNRFTLFGSGSKKEEAVELYSKAGNAFKVAKRCALVCINLLHVCFVASHSQRLACLLRLRCYSV